MKKIIITPVFLLVLVCLYSVNGQIIPKRLLQNNEDREASPAGNTINDILVTDEEVWIGTKKLCMSSDKGSSWNMFGEEEGVGKGSISAIVSRNDEIWTATGYDTVDGSGRSRDAGGGLGYTTDKGLTWQWIPQPVDSPDVTEYKPTKSRIENIIYDIALTDPNTVWIASFVGGLRKSSDHGKTWKIITVDGFSFAPLEHLTHQAFSVIYDESAIWAGTAGGIHKSMDGGDNWITYNHTNQDYPISGNFVVAIAHQNISGKDIIWAATWPALGETEYPGVSVTMDRGFTWKVVLEGEYVHNIVFDGAIVYAASDKGLYKSLDMGDTWSCFSNIKDTNSGDRVFTPVVNCAGVDQQKNLWIGTTDGLALTADNGLTWKIFRAFQSTSDPAEPETYAYPNPFSPLRDNLYGGDGHIRFQYYLTEPSIVTVKIYDFGMNLVKTVIHNKERHLSGDCCEVWDGRNDVGDIVANGAYFYKIKLKGRDPIWGKVLILN